MAEGAEYTELVVGDSPETGTFYKYGGYIPLTLELIDRDETRKLAAYPQELANAALRKISGLVAAIFTDNSDVGPTLADTGALFNATAVTTAGGHANLLTTALASAEWEVVSRRRLQPAPAHQAGRRLLRHRLQDGRQPALLPGAPRPAADRVRDPVSHPEERQPASTARTCSAAPRAT